MTAALRWVTLLALLLCLSHGLVWTLARAYERGQLAQAFLVIQQGVELSAANQALWAAVDRDVRLCHDRLMRLAVRPK